MLFSPLTPARLPKTQLQPDFAAAQQVGRTWSGQLALYYKKAFFMGYLPYSAICYAWVREEHIPVPGKMELIQYFVLAEDSDKTVKWFAVPSEEEGRRVLDRIALYNPDVRLGMPGTI